MLSFGIIKVLFEVVLLMLLLFLNTSSLTILRNTKVTKAAGLDNLSAALEIESKEPQQNFCCHKLLFIAV